MSKQIPFSEARQRLSAIVDEVQRPGQTVTIMKHGKPAAVIVGHAEYQARLVITKAGKKWKLAGSGRIAKGVNIDKVLKSAEERRVRSWRSNMQRLTRDLSKK